MRVTWRVMTALMIAISSAVTSCVGQSALQTAGLPALRTELLLIPGEVGADPPGVFGRQKLLGVSREPPHVRYRISTTVTAQATAAEDGLSVFVVDPPDAEAQIRSFDSRTGREIARARIPEAKNVVQSPSGRGAVAVDGQNRVLILYAGGSHRASPTWVRALDRHTLQDLGTVAEIDSCGDLLVAAGARFAVICSAKGEIHIFGSASHGKVALGTSLADATFLRDGALGFVTTDGQVGTISTGSTSPHVLPGGRIAKPRAIASVGTDSLAVVSMDSAELTVVDVASAARVRTQLASSPVSGLVAHWPYAYFVSERGLEYVDLATGWGDVLPIAVSAAATPTGLVPP